MVVFWFWWVSLPLPATDPRYVIPDNIKLPTVEYSVYSGFDEVFVTVTPVP